MNSYYFHRKTEKSPFLTYAVIAILFFSLGFKISASGITINPESEKLVIPDSIRQIGLNDEKVDLNHFWTVWSEVEKNYVDLEKVDPQKMVYGSIKGMVDSLGDPYTVFMTPEESKEFSASLDGKLEGIGAELSLKDGNLIIVSPLRDSPAEKAGLKPNDIILEVDGAPAYEMTLFEAIMKIRGEKGTKVVLTILREKTGEPFEVEIIRDTIDIESVTVEQLENGITYISVNQFNDKTLEEFNGAIASVLDEDKKAVIIDLRYNGGGYLDIAVEMLSYLLPQNSAAVKIRQRNKKDETIYTKKRPKLPSLPLLVLVNEGSASASEIVAGAIRAFKRGIVMGTQTFGKGTVQEVEMFTDGSSMRITVAKWLTPDDIDINDTGLTPDIIVEFEEEDYENEYDRQKEEAVKYLENLLKDDSSEQSAELSLVIEENS